jgi:hypothetical protein
MGLQDTYLKIGGIYYFRYGETKDTYLLLLHDYSTNPFYKDIILKGFDLHYLFFVDPEMAYIVHDKLSDFGKTGKLSREDFILTILQNCPSLKNVEDYTDIKQIKNKKSLSAIDRLNSAYKSFKIGKIASEVKVLNWEDVKNINSKISKD